MNWTSRIKTGKGGLKSALAGFWAITKKQSNAPLVYPAFKHLSNVPYRAVIRKLLRYCVASPILLTGMIGAVRPAFTQGDDIAEQLARLSDKDVFVRRNAAAQLGNLRDASATFHLRKALKDGDEQVRAQAAESLGLLGAKEAILDLSQALGGDSRANVRQSAALALSYIGDLGAVPALVSCLKDKQTEVKFSCIRALGRLKAGQAVRPLALELGSSDSHCKGAVLEALGRIGAQEAFLAVRGELEGLREKRAKGANLDQPLLVEEAAIRALGNLGKPEGIPLAKAGLSSPDDRIKSASCRALAKMGDNSELKGCLSLLSHSEPGIRRDIAETLGEMGDASTLKTLGEALDTEKNPAVVQDLNMALQRLKGRKLPAGPQQ